MQQYRDLINTILKKGEKRVDRTGIGTISYFGTQSRYDVSKYAPILTLKEIHLKSVIHELLWFLKGDTNIKYLNDNGVKIWDAWADDNGDLGHIYGHQWRKWSSNTIYGSIDQIKQVIDQIKNNPYSRRHIVSAWNVSDLEYMNLPPCHIMFQFYVSNDRELSLQLYQRSADVFLGVPFNIASYYLLLRMVAMLCDLKPKEFIHTIGDAHIYLNHINQIETMLSRDDKPLPTMAIKKRDNIDDFEFEDFTIIGYNPHPKIKGEVAV